MVVITFALIALAGLLASLGVERLLRGHLKRMLVDLCETEARSAFWVTVTGLTVVLAGVLAATSTLGYSDPQAGGYDLFLAAMTQARTSLVGLLGIVLALAFVLLNAVRRYEARTRSASRRAWPDAAPPPPPAS